MRRLAVLIEKNVSFTLKFMRMRGIDAFNGGVLA